jgi:hypothetical protein
MEIHSSHSKKELVDISSVFELGIPDIVDLNKSELVKEMIYVLEALDEILPDDTYFFIDSKQELLDYLRNPNQSKLLTIKEKTEIMTIAKNIILYCKADFFMARSGYYDFQQLYESALKISKYGDIPSVRRALSMLDHDPKIAGYQKIEPVISKKTQKQLQDKKDMKRRSQIGWSFRRKTVVLYFD